MGRLICFFGMVPQKRLNPKVTSVRDNDDRISIVICDDHRTYAEGLSLLLKNEAPDIEVVGMAHDAEKAEMVIAKTLPDAVLMDIYMPRVDGIEATRRISATSPTTKVVILTVSDADDDLYRALQAGAVAYVMKHEDPSTIADMVRRVVQGYSTFPSHMVTRLVRDLNESSRLVALTREERALLAHLGNGLTDNQMASRLKVADRTIRRRLLNIYSKLHLSGRMQAVLFAAKQEIANPLKSPQSPRDL